MQTVQYQTQHEQVEAVHPLGLALIFLRSTGPRHTNGLPAMRIRPLERLPRAHEARAQRRVVRAPDVGHDAVLHVVHERAGVELHRERAVRAPARLRALGEDRADDNFFLREADVRRVRERVRRADVAQLAGVVREERVELGGRERWGGRGGGREGQSGEGRRGGERAFDEWGEGAEDRVRVRVRQRVGEGERRVRVDELDVAEEHAERAVRLVVVGVARVGDLGLLPVGLERDERARERVRVEVDGDAVLRVVDGLGAELGELQAARVAGAFLEE